jgi:hypothetical protein
MKCHCGQFTLTSNAIRWATTKTEAHTPDRCGEFQEIRTHYVFGRKTMRFGLTVHWRGEERPREWVGT